MQRIAVEESQRKRGVKQELFAHLIALRKRTTAKTRPRTTGYANQLRTRNSAAAQAHARRDPPRHMSTASEQILRSPVEKAEWKAWRQVNPKFPGCDKAQLIDWHQQFQLSGVPGTGNISMRCAARRWPLSTRRRESTFSAGQSVRLASVRFGRLRASLPAGGWRVGSCGWGRFRRTWEQRYAGLSFMSSHLCSYTWEQETSMIPAVSDFNSMRYPRFSLQNHGELRVNKIPERQTSRMRH